MLTGTEIKTKKLIENASEQSYRAASYDLQIAHFITPDGQLVDSYKIPAQGIVEVISCERVRIPLDISGFAMVKTSLCNEGLLPLNIGILDPGYAGKIASYLVNFGKSERVLNKGDVFLRLTFHSLEGYVGDGRVTEIADDLYLSDKKRNMQHTFGPTFLDVGAVTERFAKETFEQYKLKAFSYIAAAAFLLAILTFCLNFGNMLLVQKFLQPSDVTKAELLRSSLDVRNKQADELEQSLVKRLEQLDHQSATRSAQLDKMVDRIENVEKALAATAGVQKPRRASNKTR